MKNKGYVLIITGDRTAEQPPLVHQWMGVVAETIIDHVAGTLYQSTMIHGDCTGIDTLADIVANHVLSTKFDDVMRFEVTDEDWRVIGKKAGPMRNSRMLSQGLKIEKEQEKELIVLAYHQDIRSSKGTRNMVKQALTANVPVRLFTLEGEVEVPEL